MADRGLYKRTVPGRASTWVVVTCVALALMVGVGIYFANKYLYFGPTLPRQDYGALWEEHNRKVNGLQPGDATGWPLYLQLEAVLDEINAAASEGSDFESYVDYDELMMPGTPGHEVALRAVSMYETRKVSELVDALVATPAIGRPASALDFMYLSTWIKARPLTRILMFRMSQAFDAGDQATALREFDRAKRLGQLLQNEPILMSRLMGHAVVQTATERLLMDVRRVAVTPETLRRIIELTEPRSISVSEVFRGERLFALGAIQQSASDTPIKGINRSAQSEVVKRLYDAAADYAAPARNQRTDAAGRELAAAGEALQNSLVAGIISSPVGLMLNAEDRAVAVHEGRRIAFAVQTFLAERGRLPATLEELVPDILPSLPIDHFSGGPYVYKLEGQDFRLYSVGPNGVDDGGLLPQAPAEGIDPPAALDLIIVPTGPTPNP